MYNATYKQVVYLVTQGFSLEEASDMSQAQLKATVLILSGLNDPKFDLEAGINREAYFGNDESKKQEYFKRQNKFKKINEKVSKKKLEEDKEYKERKERLLKLKEKIHGN